MPESKQRHRTSALLALACAAGLGACAGGVSATQSAGLDARFGEAVRHNLQAQAIAPTAAQKANRYIPPNPERQRRAVDAYEAGEVTLGELERTSGD